MAQQTKTTTLSPTLPNLPDPPWLTAFFLLWLLGMLWSALWPKSRFYGLPTLYLNTCSLRLVKWWQKSCGAHVCKLVGYVSRQRPIDIEEGVELTELPICSRHIYNGHWEHVRVGDKDGEGVLGLGRRGMQQMEAEVEQKRLVDDVQQRLEIEEEAAVARKEGEKREVERARDETLRVLEGRSLRRLDERE
jgi:hypothetical protein